MMCARSKIFASLSLGLIAAVITGCASQGFDTPNDAGVRERRRDEKGLVQNTGIQSQDIVAVTDKMVRGIMAVPEIAGAQKPLRIVLLPVKSDTPLAINRDVFLDKITSLLNECAAGKVHFLMGQATGDTDPNIQQAKGADFLLTSKLARETTMTSAGTTDYLLYSFELINPSTREIIWNGSHRLKKQGQTGTIYR